MSSTRSAAISVLVRATSRPSASSSASRATSATVMSPERLPRTARTACSIASSPECPSGMAEHLLDLLAQSLCVERFHDVIGDARLLRGDDILCLALGGDHDEGHVLQTCI